MRVELKRLSLIDWDFPSRTSQVLMHDICWYPARFVPAIPSHLIDALSYPGQSICDPFCGSGTTIVEALLLGRTAIGFDVNPFAIHIARTKCHIVERPEVLTSNAVSRIARSVQILAQEAPSPTNAKFALSDSKRKKESKTRRQGRQQELFPDSPRISDSHQVESRDCSKVGQPLNCLEIEKWFHPQTLPQLYRLNSLVREAYPENIRQILETVFIATLMPASGHRARKPYGYFADNVVPKERIYRTAFQLFYNRLARLISRCAQLSNDLPSGEPPKYKLHVGDARSSQLWNDTTVDCIITSPPYPGAVDYCTAFRLASYWFPQYGRIEELRASEIGARWARRRQSSRQEYFDNIRLVFASALARLAPHGFVALVLPIGRQQTPTINRIVRSLLDADGLREVARTERRISKRYFVRQGGGIKREVVIVFRKG
jgi:hypothetical protein